jgi:hypothetical protein
MVFTIVTIIFLPMSFMAAFFTINITEFPHDSTNGGNGLHLSYVAKYMFGIGFGISIPLIMIAFIMTDTEGWLWSLKNWVNLKKASKHTLAANPGDREDRGLEMEKGRSSVEGWRYRHPLRVDTGGTDKSRRTQDIVIVSPV